MSVTFDRTYYEQVISEHGYDPVEVQAINFGLTGWSLAELSQQWLCHMRGHHFAKAQAAGQDTIATTGFGISGVPHAGTLAQILKAIRLQQSGLPVQIVLGDLDAHNGKGVPLAYTQEMAERFRAFILALGFCDEAPSILRTQYDNPEVCRLAYLLGHYMDDPAFEATEEDLHQFYATKGKVDESMTYRRKASLNLMIADFADLAVSGGYGHIMVFLGVDEHRYVKFGADVIARASAHSDWLGHDVTLAALYSPIIKGFFGFPKMSKSFPNSGVTVDMETSVIARLLIDGESESAGPDDNVVFQMISMASLFSHAEITSARDAYHSGGRAWQRTKSSYTDHLIDLCSRWEG